MRKKTFYADKRRMDRALMIKTSLERCQPWRVKKAKCRLCVEACPVDGCVSFSDNILSIDGGLCNGCGICAGACPTGALTLEGLGEAELVDRVLAGKGKKVFFTCALGPGAGGATVGGKGVDTLRLNCLAVVKESALATLALSGVEEISLDLSKCPECGFKKGKEIIERSVLYAENLVTACGLGTRVRAVYAEGKEKKGSSVKAGKARDLKPGPVYSRRDLFSLLRERAAISVSADKKEGSGDCGDGLSPARAVLTNAIKGALKDGADPFIADRAFSVRSLAIKEGCTMCARCESFCPTGALKRIEEGLEARIDFEMGLCTGCYECAEFCPTGALVYNDAVRLLEMTGPPETLSRRTFTECPACGTTYLPEPGEQCPACAKREKLDRRIQSIIFGERV